MRTVIQRVSTASVEVDGRAIGSIAHGLLVLIGIEEADGQEDVIWLSGKIVSLRVFNDDQGVMNRNVIEAAGGILAISQFTLHAQTRKGNRPSYIKAAKPEIAIPIYEAMVSQLSKDLGRPVATGIFGADMKVSLVNDGPVTIIMDTKNKE